jgi:hypothetical protein
MVIHTTLVDLRLNEVNLSCRTALQLGRRSSERGLMRKARPQALVTGDVVVEASACQPMDGSDSDHICTTLAHRRTIVRILREEAGQPFRAYESYLRVVGIFLRTASISAANTTIIVRVTVSPERVAFDS